MSNIFSRFVGVRALNQPMLNSHQVKNGGKRDQQTLLGNSSGDSVESTSSVPGMLPFKL